MTGKTSQFLVIAIALVTLIGLASAEELRGHPGRVSEPRAKGVIQHGTERHIPAPGGQIVHTPVFRENRNIAEVRRDPHVVQFNHIGWHPVGHWNYWFRDWGVFWRIADWNAIRSVTCEAVDTQTELLYPVSETRSDSWYWNVGLVNNVAARALDECVAESGHTDSCALVQGECWNSIY